MPDFPEPNSRGVLPSARLRAIHRRSPAKRESAALGACANLLANHNRAPPVAVRLLPQTRRRYVACMRAHGLPRFAFAGSGDSAAAVSLARYLRAHASELERASQACRGLLPRL